MCNLEYVALVGYLHVMPRLRILPREQGIMRRVTQARRRCRPVPILIYRPIGDYECILTMMEHPIPRTLRCSLVLRAVRIAELRLPLDVGL